MSSGIRSRFRRDAVQGASAASGNVDVTSLLSSWFDDPVWVDELAAMPEAVRRAELIEVAGEVFDDDVGNVRTELLWNSRDTDWVWSPRSLVDGLREHLVHVFLDVSDRIALATGTAEPATVVGLQHLTDALSAGRGVLLLLVLQRHPAWALTSDALRSLVVTVVQHTDTGVTWHAAPTVRVVPATPSSMRRLVTTVDGNGVVCFANDYVFPGTPAMPSPLVGFDVPVSKGIVALAVRRGVPTVPVSITRDGCADAGPAVFQLYAPIASQADNESQALVLGLATECLIRRAPDQWRLWNTLRSRVDDAARAFAPGERMVGV